MMLTSDVSAANTVPHSSNDFERKYSHVFQKLGMSLKGMPHSQQQQQLMESNEETENAKIKRNKKKRQRVTNDGLYWKKKTTPTPQTSNTKNEKDNEKETCLWKICTKKHPVLMFVFVFMAVSLMFSTNKYLNKVITQLMDMDPLNKEKNDNKAIKISRLIFFKGIIVLLLYSYMIKGNEHYKQQDINDNNHQRNHHNMNLNINLPKKNQLLHKRKFDTYISSSVARDDFVNSIDNNDDNSSGSGSDNDE